MERANQRQERRQRQAFLLAAITILAAPSFAQSAPPQSSLTPPASPASEPARRVVLISIPDRKLAVLQDGNVLAQFSIAVGAVATPSPTGELQIVNRVSNPTYYHDGNVIPTGKDNPVGTRWMGLSQKGYGIHGTNAPHSIGHAASHGCIRLRNRDMERLFAMLRVGDVVVIRGERDDETAQVFGTGDDHTTLASAQMPVPVGQ
jgi:lipoprotein-anchoring transpeptidase ErfK/SrfK